ncbi:MAG: sigma-54-dependent Fis family transcriptional regulator [Candidatus Omnitrophica bacterium]|nr:sigma-54-dependent Fis family transcriptional regulator [Candidatus Omnitrophota bacterium]
MTNHNHILIVDDESLTRKSLYEILKREGYRVSTSVDGEEALKAVEKELPDIVITDLKMPKIDGLSLLRRLKADHPSTAVVLMTAYGSIENAVEAMKEGAFDYVTKPIIDNEIKIIIQRIFEQRRLLDENELLKKQLTQTSRAKFHDLIGQNYKMQRIYNLIETVAPTNATILIQGESGTGKRLIAHALHFSDPNRKDKPFVEVSCGALPENLLESELFGHVKGSFTSAVRDRQGRFEAANGGTIFLDEIDTFSPKLQVKLLRILQEGEFERVGDTNTVKVDVRVVAATNQDLKTLISQGQFREDLYYRLNVIPIYLSPLRERRDDIAMLVEHFLKKCNKKMKDKKIKGVSSQAMQLLVNYTWPGNVRELENVIERAVILSSDSSIEVADLPEGFQEVKIQDEKDRPSGEQSLLKDALELSERKIIQDALERCRGNRKKAAQALGINRTTLYNKMRKLGIMENE